MIIHLRQSQHPSHFTNPRQRDVAAYELGCLNIFRMYANAMGIWGRHQPRKQVDVACTLLYAGFRQKRQCI